MKSSGASRIRFGANLAWTLTGRLSYAAVQWLIVVLIARLGGAADVGLLAIALAIANPIMVFSQLGLRPLKATAGSDDHPPAHYFSLRLVTTAGAIVVAMSVATVAGLDSRTLVVFGWVILAKALDNMSDVLYGFLQNLERHDVMSTSLFVRSVIALTVIAVGYLATGSLAVAMALQALAWGVVFAVFDLPRTARLLGMSHDLHHGRLVVWDPKGWQRLIGLGVPLGVAAFLASFLSNIPRYFIEHYLGRVQLGQFAAMAHFVTLMILLANSAAQAVAPGLGQALGSDDSGAFFRLLRRLRLAALGIGVAGIIGAVAFGQWLIVAVYGPPFRDVAPLLPLVMLAGGLSFAATFASYGLIAARQASAMQRALLVATGLCVVASIIAVPRFGLIGALAAWNIGVAAQWLLSELEIRRFRVSLSRSWMELNG